MNYPLLLGIAGKFHLYDNLSNSRVDDVFFLKSVLAKGFREKLYSLQE
jgi:hypothetical protein